jgi:hypothetical protein
MTKIESYQAILRQLPVWEDFLRSESNLPGPRSNLELAYAAADLATPERLEQLLSYLPNAAPNTPDEFLALCGTIGLWRPLYAGQEDILPRLQQLANDPRWRIREGVAMALQLLGDKNMDRLITSIQPWKDGSYYEQRAAAAALCEPRLLKNREHARSVLAMLDHITQNIAASQETKTDAFKTLVKGMSYCWSVAVAALPEDGKIRFEAWMDCDNKIIQTILRENLKKNRLIKMDPLWVEQLRAKQRG